MATAHFSKLLERLISKFQAWQESRNHVADVPQEAVSATARGAMLDELEKLRSAYAAGAAPRKPTLFDAISRWIEPAVGDRAARERGLLREYERLCDLDLPLRISTVLLRHYSLLKRASHLPAAHRAPLLAMPSTLEVSAQA